MKPTERTYDPLSCAVYFFSPSEHTLGIFHPNDFVDKSLTPIFPTVLKDGKIVVLLQGRYAGKKAVILKTDDDGNKERSYGHCVVAGKHTLNQPSLRASY